jgi:hypothetical protein
MFIKKENCENSAFFIITIIIIVPNVIIINKLLNHKYSSCNLFITSIVILTDKSKYNFGETEFWQSLSDENSFTILQEQFCQTMCLLNCSKQRFEIDNILCFVSYALNIKTSLSCSEWSLTFFLHIMLYSEFVDILASRYFVI